MQSTALIDRLGVQNLRNAEYVAEIHASISEYQRRFDVKTSNPPTNRSFDFQSVNDAKFDSIYASLADSLDDLTQNTTTNERALQLLKWSQVNSNWNSIFTSKISDLDPGKFNNIISDSKFDILNSLQFPYAIALNLIIQEPLVAESIAEPIISSFRYNFENPMSKLSRFNKIENSFLFIKLQFDLCMVALGKSWVTLEKNKELLINKLRVSNSIRLIDTLLEWRPIESVGLVLSKYFKKFILSRLSYFIYDYFDASRLMISQLSTLSNFDNIIQDGVSKSPENIKISRVLIGGLFNLAIKWNEIDHKSSMELLRDEMIPSLTRGGDYTVGMISYWQEIQAEVIGESITEIFDTCLIESLKDLIDSSSKYAGLLENPESYIECTIGIFIDRALQIIKSGWNEIHNILESIEDSSKYLKIISEITLLCETSEIASMIPLENAYSMRDKMHKIFILCLDEHLQGELKYLQKKIFNFDLFEERIAVLSNYSSTVSFNEIFSAVASNAEKIILDYIIPKDNLMSIKSESSLDLLTENLKELSSVMPVPMPCVDELIYIFRHIDEEIDLEGFHALDPIQAEQAVSQALHAKLDFQEFALLSKRSN